MVVHIRLPPLTLPPPPPPPLLLLLPGDGGTEEADGRLQDGSRGSPSAAGRGTQRSQESLHTPRGQSPLCLEMCCDDDNDDDIIVCVCVIR